MLDKSTSLADLAFLILITEQFWAPDPAGMALLFGHWIQVFRCGWSGASVSLEINVLTRPNVGARDDARENREGCLGLIRRHCMACVVNAGEGEPSILTDLTSNVSVIDDNRSVTGILKSLVVMNLARQCE